MLLFFVLLMFGEAFGGFSGESSCDDLHGATRVFIDFLNSDECECEGWDSVQRVVFTDNSTDATYHDCDGSVREFVWRRRPKHAPWDEWMEHRVITPDAITLYPHQVCKENATLGIFCGTGYYKDICDKTGGIVVGVLLMSIVGVVTIVFLLACLSEKRGSPPLSTKLAPRAGMRFVSLKY